MKVINVLLILTLLLFSQDGSVLQKESSSFVKTYFAETGEIHTQIVNRNFDVINTSVNGRFSNILLEQTLNQTIIPGVEGRKTEIDIIAWELIKNKYEKKLWEINDVGYKVEKYYKYLKLLSYGCCGAEDSYIYYNAETGQKLLTATSNFTFLRIPNSKLQRIFAFNSSTGILNYEEGKLYPGQIGILQYASDHKLIQQILIVGNLNDLHITPEILLKTKKRESRNLDLWESNHSNNPQSISGFDVVLDFNLFKIVIPVLKDRLNIVKASFPEQFDIRLIPVGINSTEYLAEERFSKLDLLTKEELRFLRNEIFARHGHSFDSPELKAFFSKKVWYQEIPEHKVSEREFSDDEIAVIQGIRELENK